MVLRRSTAHRGGKVVTVVGDWPADISGAELEGWLRVLRQKCHAGGTLRDRTIEIQGERVDKLRRWLREAGFEVAGGA